MMRSLLAVPVATAAVLVATAVPAHAAVSYCHVRLVAAAAGTSASCTTPDPNENGLVLRRLDVHVQTGAVTATVTCGDNSESITVAAPFTGSVTVVQRRFYSCTHTLTSLHALSTAVGVSTYTVTHV